MQNKSSAQIRKDFFKFFQEKDHVLVQSAPVVPRSDATLLFTNAGMNQFKPIFMGSQDGLRQGDVVHQRAVDTQRCIRVSGKHNDLEEVGRDTYHHTLFEMLGNWSFGDYFKKEAIRWAWQLLTDVWQLEPDRLYATIFEGDESNNLPMDEEARRCWKTETAIHHAHILNGSKADNFWEMGDTGPCGPCSEVHIDLRSTEERAKKPGHELVNKDHPRVMEIWNLVFIQFNRQPGGSLNPLPAQHVDTGMGFERICAVLQEKTSDYDTDLFAPLLNKIETLAGTSYGSDAQTDIAMQVIADHIRSVSFAIADGAPPDNDGRGYVVRRILRRAVRYGWDKLDLKQPFFHQLVPVLAHQFKNIFPVLAHQQGYVMNVIKSEEESFLHTLGQGIGLFNEIVAHKSTISGAEAFKLHDTYGFPIDLTELMARERGVEVDSEGFKQHMQQQKERSRAAGHFSVDQSQNGAWHWITEQHESSFVGYDQLETHTPILAYRQTDDGAALLLEKTPFYAESGGQVADTGTLSQGENEIQVQDVQKSDAGFIHIVDQLPNVLEGIWQAKIDKKRRQEIMKHHTATHLLHAALRDRLGNHVAQKGSLVDAHHLRFDFSHYEQMTDKEMSDVEAIVNQRIQENIARQEDRNVPIEEAEKRGATMLFGEKYDEKVRIITFDPTYSMELCGGTHADATGRLGYFRLTSESSAAAGVRRVEAVVGASADTQLRYEKELLKAVRRQLGQSEDPAADIERLQNERKQLEDRNETLQQQQGSQLLDQKISGAEEICGILLVTGEIPGAGMDLLKQLGHEALEKCPKGAVIVLGSADMKAGKAVIMASISDDVIDTKGLNASQLVASLGQQLGGGGGGQPNLATAGGSKPGKLADVLKNVRSYVKDQIKEKK